MSKSVYYLTFVTANTHVNLVFCTSFISCCRVGSVTFVTRDDIVILGPYNVNQV